MAVNRVDYAGAVLIDLSSDTVSETTLVNGMTAHAADGSIITGTLFKGYPDEIYLYESTYDSSGEAIMDSSGEVIESTTIYQKA